MVFGDLVAARLPLPLSCPYFKHSHPLFSNLRRDRFPQCSDSGLIDSHQGHRCSQRTKAKFPQPNPALNPRIHSLSLLPPLFGRWSSSSLRSPLQLSTFSTLLPLNRTSSSVVRTPVDAASTETWRTRSGRDGCKKDALLAAWYVFDLDMNVTGLTRLLSACQLFLQPKAFPPVAGILYIADFDHFAAIEYHICCMWSVDVQSGIGSLTAHVIDRPGKISPALFYLAIPCASP